jgi:hypothetical protein
MLQMAQLIDPAMAEQMAAGIMGGQSVPAMGGAAPAQNVAQTEALGGNDGPKEASTTKKARQRVAESTSPT